MRQTRFGAPLPPRGGSKHSTFIVDPGGGWHLDQPPTDLPPNFTPDAQNYIIRDGALEPRKRLTPRSDDTTGITTPIVTGLEVVDVLGNTYPWCSHQTQPVWYSVGSWSQLSYVSAFGTNDPIANSTASFMAATQMYGQPLQDENLVIFASPSYQSLYCWQSNTTVFSTLTGAPRAKCVAVFDSYLVAANIREGSNDFVQRVQWAHRASVSSWTGSNTLNGFLDLLDAKGQITRLLPQEDRLLAFTDKEIWELRSTGLPFIFTYQAVDRSVGCPFPATVTDTPRGVLFMGPDYNLYALPKGGGTAEAVGGAVHKDLRTTINNPQRAWGGYNRDTDQAEMYYPVQGGTGYPDRAVYFDLKTGAWMPQRFDAIPLTYGWPGSLGTGSKATTWADLAAAGIKWSGMNLTWAQLNGTTGAGPLAMYAGGSGGQKLYFSASATSESGQTVTRRWRSPALAGDEPTRMKTLTQVLVDYKADSASSLSIRCSSDQGRTFDQGVEVLLPASSVESQARFDVYAPSRYPMFEVLSEKGDPSLYRFHATYRQQGR